MKSGGGQEEGGVGRENDVITYGLAKATYLSMNKMHILLRTAQMMLIEPLITTVSLNIKHRSN